jgi:hypothetical protein
MGTFLDIVGSVMLAGLLTLTFGTLMGDRQSALMESNDQSTIQLQMDNASELLLSDLRKIGFMTAVEPVLSCQARSITFLGDIDYNGSVDTVRYRMGGPVDYTPNPNDSLLCRQVNSGPESASDLGVTSLRFIYFNAAGSVTTTANDVASVQVRITVQSRSPVDSTYQSITQDLRVSPRNLK